MTGRACVCQEAFWDWSELQRGHRFIERHVKVYEIKHRYMSLSQTSLLPRGSPYAPKTVAGTCRKYQKHERNLCVFAKNRQYPDQVGASYV